MNFEEALDVLVNKIQIDVKYTDNFDRGYECLIKCKEALEKQMKNEKDFGLLCVCAARYTLPRATYMPGEVIRIIKENINLLDYNSVYVIKRDIREHLDGEHPYIFEYDKDTWEEFYEWLCTDRNYEVN